MKIATMFYSFSVLVLTFTDEKTHVISFNGMFILEVLLGESQQICNKAWLGDQWSLQPEEPHQSSTYHTQHWKIGCELLCFVCCCCRFIQLIKHSFETIFRSITSELTKQNNGTIRLGLLGFIELFSLLVHVKAERSWQFEYLVTVHSRFAWQ